MAQATKQTQMKTNQIEKFFAIQHLMQVYRMNTRDKTILVADIFTMNKKFNILVHPNNDIELIWSYTNESYGMITLQHAKRLIKNSK